MQARIKNPLALIPDSLQALLALDKATDKAELPYVTRKLMHLRASQINGCSMCTLMHARELRKEGESDDRIFAVGAWRETSLFADAERAALELTECLTRIADRSDPVPDSVWNEAAQHWTEKQLAGLVLQIGLINTFNRINVAVRQIADTKW